MRLYTTNVVMNATLLVLKLKDLGLALAIINSANEHAALLIEFAELYAEEARGG